MQRGQQGLTLRLEGKQRTNARLGDKVGTNAQGFSLGFRQDLGLEGLLDQNQIKARQRQVRLGLKDENQPTLGLDQEDLRFAKVKATYNNVALGFLEKKSTKNIHQGFSKTRRLIQQSFARVLQKKDLKQNFARVSPRRIKTKQPCTRVLQERMDQPKNNVIPKNLLQNNGEITPDKKPNQN